MTAATYVSVGGAAPVRAGLTLVKDARKVGRLGEGLTQWAGRSAREVVDAPVLQQAVASGSVLRPGETVSAIKAAFRAEKAGALVRLAKDVGRVGEKAGTRGALDTLRIAEGPKDVARAARLAEAKGGQTRAILKMLGRGALLLAAGAFNLTLWVFGALLALFGFLSSIKATTERATMAWLRRKKARRLRRQLAAALAAAGPGSGGRRRARLRLAVIARSPILESPKHGTDDAEFSQRRCRNCLSRRRRGRSDRSRARLCLEQERQLGLSDLGFRPEEGRPPRHRARQSRPWRFRQSSTMPRSTRSRSWPATSSR